MAARFSFMPLLDEIEPLKQAALTELKAAVDLPALEQSKGAWIGPNGKFTALMKQLGTLSKEEKPAAGKAVNVAKLELEAALVECRSQLELKAVLPKEPTDFSLPGRRRILGKPEYLEEASSALHLLSGRSHWVYTGIAVMTLPQTNLFLQARGWATAPPRGLTALRPLLEAGVTVAARPR